MKAITFRLKPGQLLKEEIERRAVEMDIEAGVLLSIVGALRQATLRMAGAKPGNEMIRLFPGPLEIVSGTGTISREGCHLHISVSDANGAVFGGHLKGGCIVDVTAEIVIAVFDGIPYKRVMDHETGYKELMLE